MFVFVEPLIAFDFAPVVHDAVVDADEFHFFEFAEGKEGLNGPVDFVEFAVFVDAFVLGRERLYFTAAEVEVGNVDGGGLHVLIL